jgi:hypothetical protein
MENRCKTKIFFILLGILLLFPFINAQSIDAGTWIQDRIDVIKSMNISFATTGWYKSLDEGFGGKLPGGITRKQFMINAGNRPGDERSFIMDTYTNKVMTQKELTAKGLSLEYPNIKEYTYTLNRDGIWYDESGQPAPKWFQDKYGGLNRYWISDVAKQEEKVWRIK